MKYELMYWHTFFVRKGDFIRAEVAMYFLRAIGEFSFYASPSYHPRSIVAAWRIDFATPIN
jgi:hypothetical protein